MDMVLSQRKGIGPNDLGGWVNEAAGYLPEQGVMVQRRAQPPLEVRSRLVVNLEARGELPNLNGRIRLGEKLQGLEELCEG